MASPLAGALAKIGRAEEHLGCLDEAIAGWRNVCGASPAADRNDERTEWRFYVEFRTPPDVARWALLMGDCVHNLRSALDHAAYELAVGQDGKVPRGTEFPIFADAKYVTLPEDNPRSYRYKIRGIKHPVARALIEGAQPCNGPNPPDQHSLWVIHSLDIEDKHHLLIPVGQVPREFDMGLVIEFIDSPPPGRPFDTVHPLWVPLQKKALLLTVLTVAPARRVKMEVKATLGIGIRLGAEVGGVTGTLGELCKYTRGLIEQIRDAIV